MSRPSLTIDLTEDSDEEEAPDIHYRTVDADGGYGDVQHSVPSNAFNYKTPARPSPQSHFNSRYTSAAMNRPPGYRSIRPTRRYEQPISLRPESPSFSTGSNANLTNSSKDSADAANGICIQCARYPDVSCDGDQPCAPCQVVGDDCLYPGQDPLVVRQQFSSPYHHDHQTPLNDNDSSTDQVPGNEFAKISDVEADGAYEEVNHSADTSRFNLDSLEGVKDLLRMHEARMRTHREYLMQPLLARARMECLNSPLPTRGTPGKNPFDKLVNGNKSSSSNRSKASMVVQMRSHSAGASKKWTSFSTPLTVVARDPTILPKYKSIGRLGNVLLARNSYVKKYLPYFADEVPEAERKREEDIAKWYQTDHDSMHRQRSCLELLQLWKPVVEQFISDLEIQFKDILWYILSAEFSRRCVTCEKSIKKERFVAGLRLLNKPDEQSLTRARLACEALQDVAEIHMWHIVVEVDYVKRMVDHLEPVQKPSSTLCSICFVHDCMSHGGFDEPSDENSGTFAFMGGSGGKRRPMMINDDEEDVNQRVSIVLPDRTRNISHQCGVYCVDTTTPIKAILGRKSDGSIGGVYNRATHVTRPAFDNVDDCGPGCFWQVGNRMGFSWVAHTKFFNPKMSSESESLFKQLLRLVSTNQRAPCMIARDVEEISCMDAFYYMLAISQQPEHFEQARADLHQLSLQKASRITQGLDASMSSQLDERPPFVPCSHDGPCNEDSDCSCSQDQVHCEYFCGCDEGCKRRFHGCSCAGKNKVCFNDDRCECWAQNRECDPWLCKSCGAVEVLDPANKFRDDIRKGRCRNTNLQLDLPAKTIKAPSEVQGWGLYAGQDLEANTFIGEYKGEIVGNQESDRRGSIYHHLGQEYLFVTNNEQQIDGSNFGNKTRFINNSQRNDYINVLAKKLLCYGVQRVMLYAKRAIKAGDELLYNYNYPDSVTKTFWERGEGPAQVSGAVVAKPALPSSGRIAKIADRSISRSRMAHHAGDDGSRSSSKRKRVTEQDGGRSHWTPVAGFVLNDSDPSEHDEADAYGSLDEVDDDDDDDDDGDGAEDSSEEIQTSGMVIRKRRIHPQDGRLGGNAQRKAWETRKNRARLVTH